MLMPRTKTSFWLKRKATKLTQPEQLFHFDIEVCVPEVLMNAGEQDTMPSSLRDSIACRL